MRPNPPLPKAFGNCERFDIEPFPPDQFSTRSVKFIVMDNARGGMCNVQLAKAIQLLMSPHQAAIASASAAAPYVHPRQAARDFHFPPDGRMEHTPEFNGQYRNNADVPKEDEEDETEAR